MVVGQAPRGIPRSLVIETLINIPGNQNIYTRGRPRAARGGSGRENEVSRKWTGDAAVNSCNIEYVNPRDLLRTLLSFGNHVAVVVLRASPTRK